MKPEKEKTLSTEKAGDHCYAGTDIPMRMTKQEVVKWAAGRDFEDVCLEHDGSGNEWKSVVYRVGDRLFSVGYCNGSPSSNQIGDPKNYAPVEVEAYTETFTRYRRGKQ